MAGKKSGGPNVYLNDVVIAASLVTVRGALLNLKNTSDERETKMFMVDDAGHRVDQRYLCAEGICKPDDGTAGWPARDLTKRGKEVDGTTVIMTEEEVEAAKGSTLEKNLLTLTAVPKGDLETRTFPVGTPYWFEPEASAAKAYVLLREQLAGDVALVGTVNLRGNDKFVRLLPFAGGFVLQELLRPQEVHSFEAITADVSDKERTMSGALFEAITEEFNPDDFASEKVAALRALISSKADDDGTGATVTPITAAKSKKDADMADQLAIAIAAAQAAKLAKAAKSA